MTALTVLAVLESILSLFCLSYYLQDKVPTMMGFDGLGGFGNFPRSWSQRDVPFRRCQKTCRRVKAGTQPHCEHTSWMFLSWEVVADFPKESVKPHGWKMEIFPVGNIHELSGCRKGHSDHLPVENGPFCGENENFPDTPMETLVMHPTHTDDARNRAGQSQTCKVLQTPNKLCNRSVSFLLLGLLANFPEYLLEKNA